VTSTGPDVWGVFVDELRIFATASPGADWWVLYVSHQPAERLTCLAMSPCGGHWHVACDNRDDAEMVRDQIAGHGINPKLLKVTTLSACLKIKAAGRASSLPAEGRRSGEDLPLQALRRHL
jgi:hypothetical protein